ncbi:hypothetical protein GCM10009868_41040 [Terrabacter aerolatus]|uniref:Uncharacterized protein n=1 Tax=Terrabacter aerolatus TaxID=422442 RepID=A0A512D624_9MICO|nr:hypothetical protein [Terrabacter aerolatus]GEO31918.1 hypothetical protein TAE01_37280 [Terrabacter aerolatus]
MLRLKKPRQEPDVSEIHEDARHLALEAAGLVPSPVVDVMRRGIVLETGERAWREVGVELRHRVEGEWCAAMPATGLVTDRRVLLRTSAGNCISLWWGTLVRFEPALSRGYVIFDYGDGVPRLLSGGQVPVVAVAGVMALYGVAGLTEHPALERLRAGS